MPDPENPNPEGPQEGPEAPKPEGQPPEGELAPAPEAPPAEAPAVPEAPAAPAEPTPAAAPPAPASVDPQVLREQIMDKTGFSEEQLRYVDQLVVASNAPYQEKVAWNDLKEKRPDAGKYKAQIEAEIKNGHYAPGSAGDPVLLEKIYWMEKGKSMENPNGNPPRRPVPNTPPAGGEVIRRTVSGGFSEGQDTTGQSAVTLNPKEKQMAAAFGMSEKEYDYYKVNRPITSKTKQVFG